MDQNVEKQVAGSIPGNEGEATFQLTLLTGTKLHRLRLPSVVDGQFYFTIDEEQVISIRAEHGRWIATGVSAVVYDHSSRPLEDFELRDNDYWYTLYKGERQILMIEARSAENLSFERYSFEEGLRLKIGRGEDCNIRFSNPFVSKSHALLSCVGGVFHVEDLDSSNGVFVNGKRTSATDLKLGDVVSILTMRIIIGAGFIAVNSNKPGVIIADSRIERFFPPARSPESNALALGCSNEKRFFNRLPRRRLPQPSKDISIELPPMPFSNDGIPLMLRMGGSAVYATRSAFMGNPFMLISTILFPLLTEKYTEKQRREYEEKRVTAYTNYLQEKVREISAEKREEELALQANYPPMHIVMGYPVQKTKLWERRKNDDDFLSIRVGSGQLPLKGKVVYPEERFNLEHDYLEERMYEVAEHEVVLERVPIMVDFLEHFICGVKGPRSQTLSFIQRIITRISVLHSYDEVKIVLIAQPETLAHFESVRYLPHLWDDEKRIRFIATNANEAFLVGEHLSKAIADDVEKPKTLGEILKDRPYYFVISLDKQLQDCMEILKEVSQLDCNCGMTILSAFEEISKDCSLQVNLSPEGVHSIVYLSDIEKEDQVFVLDPIDEHECSQCLKRVSNTELKTAEKLYELPKMLSFLDMYGVNDIAHLNILSRWEDSNPVSSLAAPVGVDTAGNIFNLDLHQKYQGPHGLVAGMTGSGKSEFLLTYILSLAVNYRPDEVSFLLIDYKGGGLAGAFEDKERGIVLPHLAGTITNLDGASIQRSLTCLQSEILRRQTAFNEAKDRLGEGTIDIYSYQRYYREGRLSEPLSHLFIISDEFAELKSQKPEFLDKLISIARIGRSLGVHLILATQKPGGVVNDQILSNTKFRVCLKVQTKNDSMDMLKRPEAAELRETGRFYLQVGYNEQFSLGQSAWSGAPYTPKQEAVSKEDCSIHFIDQSGQDVIVSKKREEKVASEGIQLTTIVKALSVLAKERNMQARKLWTEPLASDIDADALIEFAESKKRFNLPIGLVDDPENQEQYPYFLDLLDCKNILIVGSSGSGKTTLIENILLQILKNKPEDFVFYALDYSSRLLGLFKALPHCGGVLTDKDEGYIDSFFSLIDDTVEERKELFARLGVDNYLAAKDKEKLPLIAVVIDNFTGLNAFKKGEQYAYNMVNYLKRSSQYGIQYIISCNHPNEINLRARQEIDTRIVIQAKDRYEYEDALGVRSKYLPPEYPGRGMCVVDGRPLEVQIARFDASGSDSAKGENLRTRIDALLREPFTGFRAKPLPIVDEEIEYSDFCQSFERGVLPLGYHLENAKPVALPLRQLKGLSLYFGNKESKEPVFENILHFAQCEGMRVYLIRQETDSFAKDPEKKIDDCLDCRIFDSNDEDLERFAREIVEEFAKKQKQWNDTREERNNIPEGCDPFEYMKKHTTPFIVLFEYFEKVCHLSEAVVNTVIQLFPIFWQYAVFPIACFYPDDGYGLANTKMMKAFNKDDMVMLFGGNYSEQRCTALPSNYARITSTGEYNKFLMKYRGKLYPCMMPCRDITEDSGHIDDRSIFD